MHDKKVFFQFTLCIVHFRCAYIVTHAIQVRFIVQFDVEGRIEALSKADGQRAENKHLTNAIKNLVIKNPTTNVEVLGICVDEVFTDLIGIAKEAGRIT